MLGLKKFGLALLLGSTVALAGCNGPAKVASPGEGDFSGGGGGGGSGGGGGGGGGGTGTCPTGTTNVGSIANLTSCQIPALITGSLTLTNVSGVVYSVSGRVDVGVDQGGDAQNPVGTHGELHVEAGVRVYGSSGLDYIVINRGSQIFAIGTPTSPVIFTSKQSIEGTTGVDSIGQWGGIVILGRSFMVNCEAGGDAVQQAALYGTKDCRAQVEGTTAFFGGNNPSDNSGTLRYVRVQHSGFQILPNNELNGITFAAVGSGTTIDHLQVHNSSDDGVEFFGGNVNVKYIVLTGNDDDNLDIDEGYLGVVQFALIVQRANGGNRPIENSLDNFAATDAATAGADYPERRTNPVIANLTYVGSSASTSASAMTFNESSRARLYNTVATTTNPTPACLDIDAAIAGFEPIFKSVFMSCPVSFDADADTIEESTIFGAGTNNNTAGGASTLTNTFVNGANETAVTPVTFASLAELSASDKAALTEVTYIGAVKDASDTWWQGWTCGIGGGPAC